MNLVAAMFRFVSSSLNVESETNLSFLGGEEGEGKLKKEEGYSFFVHDRKTLYVRRTLDLGRIHICHLAALFVLNDRKFPCALYNPVSVSYNLKFKPQQRVSCVSEPYIHSVPPYLTGLRITPYFRVKSLKLKATKYNLFRQFLLIFFGLLHGSAILGRCRGASSTVELTYPHADYPDRLGPSGKFIEDSTTLIALKLPVMESGRLQ